MIRWIGLNVKGKYKIKVKSDVNQSSEEAVKLSRYGLTAQGEPVNVDAYCLKLANIMGVHLMLFQDWDPFLYDKAYSWNSSY